jgi:uncharacterized protein YecT (DUF1311 family)
MCCASDDMPQRARSNAIYSCYPVHEDYAMRFVITVLIVTLSPLLCIAQNSDPLQDCLKTAGTQAEINRCAREDARRADAALKDVNDKLLAAVATDPQAIAKITAAEKAWTAYRAAYVEAMWPNPDKRFYGTIYPTNADLLIASLTRKHIEDVKELLKEHTGQNAH